MTGTDLYMFTHKSVPVIFEPPCTMVYMSVGECLLSFGAEAFVFPFVIQKLKD